MVTGPLTAYESGVSRRQKKKSEKRTKDGYIRCRHHRAPRTLQNNRHQRGRGYEELNTPPSTPPKGGEEKPGAAESLSDCNRKSAVIEPILDDGCVDSYSARDAIT